MKVPLVALLCLVAWSGWVSCYAVDKRSAGDGRAATKKGEPAESEPSLGTYQSDMKLGVYEEEIKARIQDAKTGRHTRKALANLDFRWPSGIIPYVITDSSAGDSQAIQNAMDLWMSQTCLEFVPYTSDLGLGHQDFISFMRGDGCWSYVGRQRTGSQDISIGSGCTVIGTTAHEIAHAFGFHHEQSRSDRDDYVSIILDNVRSGSANNFDKYEAGTESLTHGLPYDMTSVMHYNTRYFSSNGKPTIITADPLDQFDLGQREYLSFYDVYLANIIYDCLSDCSGLSCQNGGYEVIIAGICKCTCPPGFTGAECEEDQTASITKCRYELTETSGSIMSPNYPSNYDDGLTCAWYIKGNPDSIITLTFDSIDVEPDAACAWDAVAVRTTSMFEDDQKFCGTSLPPPQVSSANEMMVVLTSDVSYNYKGFAAHYEISEPLGSISCSQTCGGTLMDSGCLTSPNFPNNYDNNLDCTYTLEVAEGSRVALDITALEMGSPGTKCLDDVLKISLAGGDDTQVRPLKVCGTALPSGPIISLGNKMALRFKTDSNYQSSGFEATFGKVTV